MADIDLRASGATTTINGAIFRDADNVGSGTGGYETFLAVRDNDGNLAGFNSDDSPPLETTNSNLDHAKSETVLLANIPITIVNGIAYYEFRTDLNEPENGVVSQISLDKFIVRTSTSNTIDTKAEFDAATLAYDMDAGDEKTFLLNKFSSGGGTDDYAVLVPVSNFGNVNPEETYIYLYVEMGFKGGDFTDEGGFEEWNTGKPPASSRASSSRT